MIFAIQYYSYCPRQRVLIHHKQNLRKIVTPCWDEIIHMEMSRFAFLGI